MIKKFILLSILLVGYLSVTGQVGTVYYHQDFETDSLPDGIPAEWNEYASKTFDWDTLDGGHDLNPGIPDDSNPPHAYEGSLNAYFFAQSTGYPSTYMVLPAINLKFGIEPQLTFYHAQERWLSNNDNLGIYYRTGKDSAWVFIEEYLTYTPDDEWVLRTINLPEGCLVDSCILGFKATSNAGHGVCVDDISVTEKGVVNKFLGSIIYNQIATDFIASESIENPILRLKFEIYGNSSTAILDSLALKSLNTDDDDIVANGVKLFRTREAIFATDNQLGTSESFSGGYAIFDNINYDMPPGYNYLWITYDIDSDPTHEIHNHIADAMIEAEGIFLNDTLYPSTDKSPSGSAYIYESIFYDDFEASTGWALNPISEFEIDTPQGMGTILDGLVGNPDPSAAFQGYNVLGSDLRGGSDPFPGGYDSTLTDREYYAITSAIDCNYYRSLKLSFQRWLNVENRDSALIDISTDNGSSWSNLWRNPYYVRDNLWQLQEVEIPDFDDYKTQVKIRFAIGPTDAGSQYSGWNIDNLALTGNYIAADVKVANILAPIDGCGHTSTDSITIVVENTGGQATNDTIPVVFTPDGTTFVRDTIFTILGVGQDTTFTFGPRVDLSVQGLYDEAYAATLLPGDEYHGNDTLFNTIYVPPTFTPPYFENFENGNIHWIPNGVSSSWQFGKPNGFTINTASSPDSAWVTNLTGNYNTNEDSYLESPCFNLLNMDYTIFEMKLWSDVEQYDDGGALEYSIDNGGSWSVVEKLMYKDFDWQWYTNTSGITALGTNGWDTISGGYMTVSSFLPVVLWDQPSVKFRITFASDADIVAHEGFAVDDIKIYEAPQDIGVTSIDYPTNPICQTTSSELITVSVKNFGLDTIETGDKIILGYDFNGNPAVIDTLTLTKNIKPDSTIQVMFETPVNLTGIGFFDLSTYSIDDEPYFYSPVANDTTEILLEIRGNPVVDLGPDLYTVRPDTVTLVAYSGTTGYDYEWQDASADSVYHVSDEGSFHVTVTDIATSCFTIDSTHITRLIADIGIESIMSPDSDCELGDSVFIEARILNYGTDTLHVNDTVKIAFLIDSNPVKTDTFLLPEIIYPGSMYTFTSNDTFNLSAIKTYGVKLYTILTDDNSASNDTVAKNITVYGYPSFELQPADTTLRALSFLLDAGGGFNTYHWQNNSPNQTYNVTSTGWYKVTVTDIHSCPATDSSHVTLIIQDIAVTDFFSPSTACNLGDEPVEIEISNLGSDTLQVNDTLIVAYKLDGSLAGKDSIFLTQTILPGNIINHTFNNLADLSAIQVHNFKCFTMAKGELKPQNDTLTTNVESKDEGPAINLGPDTLRVTLPHILSPGTGSGFTYLWQDGNTNSTYYVQDFGNYAVTVTDSYGCSSSDKIVIAEIINSIIEINNKPVELNIYPNPVSDLLTIQFNTEEQINIAIELVNMQGIVIYSSHLKGANELKEEIDVARYPEGPYILKLIINDKIYIQRIIIQ